MDSTALLHAVVHSAVACGYVISALHVNHGLSPNADQWQEACADFARTLNVEFSAIRVSVDLKSGDGIEQAARLARYAELDKVDADWILLGHHADDVAETFLHNLARGSGVLGLAGMQECRGRYLRPFLELSRRTLLDYARKHDLTWIEDESNTNVDYTRNFLRHQVIPVIRSRFADFAEKSALAGRRLSDAQALLMDLATLDAVGYPLLFPFPWEPFMPLSRERRTNLLRALLTGNQLQNPPEIRLNEFVSQLESAGADRHPEIRLKNHLLQRRRGMLELIPLARSSTGQ